MLRRREGGRAARKAQRAAGPAVSPCPPGAVGGQYRPLSAPDLAAVIDTAHRILAEIGMDQVPPVLREAALAKGAGTSALGRLTFSRAMVEDIIDGACKGFTLHGRAPGQDIEIGGNRVFYGTGGAAVQTQDLETGRYRAATLADLYDFTRLIDRLDRVSWFTRCCIATDIADVFEQEVNTAYTLLAGTTKPIGMSFTLGAHVDAVIDMFDLALGRDGTHADRPFCKAHISPVISPLRYGEDAVAVTEACIRRRVPINAIIAAQSGATAPAAPAGMLAHTTAETLAALVMVNVFAPGYPMIFSNWPFVIDLRTGAFCGGGGEISVMNAAAAQIGNHLGLPSGVACSMSDAKAPDAQMGMEKAISAVACGLAGANMVYESAGMMGSLLGASFEAFVLDDEMLGHVQRMIRGVEVNEETLGFDAILAAATGEGHFLGADHTIAAMQRDYFYPKLADRDPPAVWNERGGPDIRAAARERARAILLDHRPNHLSAAADRAIRDRFAIKLDLEPARG
ncbi:MAG: trimethylamine methyltransferase family protein [Pseudomonadota bacterium]